ncbi:hypothetical protein NLU13_9972 [Sarocladium strictum]|uniref:rRNA adenine N(6)-methyltransferase n=1 Tax=Sarocladium strictum TaxID=5046 RepID=A0AA39L350_SARSR|nr:hypothetical protein NLU13_9972 [Sarocladium strictum]
MFCRYQDALFRVARSASRPSVPKPRNKTTSVKVTKPRAKRTVSEVPIPAREPKPATEPESKPKRTRRTAKSPTKKSAKVESARGAFQPASGDDLLSRVQAVMPWRTSDPKARSGRAPSSVLEPGRVHVVSEKLCDDVLAYMGKSLDRHNGCDLIDLNPGSGLWSRKLHERLQPRKHVLMEGDAELYAPLLSDLTSNDNVELIPKSGIVWKDLHEMLEKCLGHQQPQNGTEPPQRNDTLLVTANLATNPARRLFGFESVSLMVLHQFVTSIHFSSLFQRYGRVRMLIWINDEDKRRMVPQSLSRRRRFAFQTELACEWLHLVVGMDNAHMDSRYLRDEWINIESAYTTLQRMQSQGLAMPAGREPQHHLDALANPELLGVRLAGARPPHLRRPFKDELEDIRAGTEVDSELSPENVKQGRRRELFLLSRERAEMQHAGIYHSLLQERDSLFEKATSMTKDEFDAASKAWLESVSGLKKNAYNEWAIIRDNYHLFRQPDPVMLWDRRAFEPLVPKASEFFPNAPCALIDLQPKAMNPLFLQHGPNSTRSGDMSDLMLRAWFAHTSHAIPHAMQALWPGFGDSFEQCPSFQDPALGGSPIGGHGAQTVRTMNEAQWTELVQAWMDWPFRPDYKLFLGRTLDEPDGQEDDDSGATGAFEG